MRAPIVAVGIINDQTTEVVVRNLYGQNKTMRLNIGAGDFAAGVEKWDEENALVQNIFPQLTAEEREFLITGILPEEWADMFPPEDEDEGAF